MVKLVVKTSGQIVDNHFLDCGPYRLKSVPLTKHNEMTVAMTLRGSAAAANSGGALEDRFEVLKDTIGDGSFGSVSLCRVRGAGSNIARRGTVVS